MHPFRQGTMVRTMFLLFLLDIVIHQLAFRYFSCLSIVAIWCALQLRDVFFSIVVYKWLGVTSCIVITASY